MGNRIRRPRPCANLHLVNLNYFETLAGKRLTFTVVLRKYISRNGCNKVIMTRIVNFTCPNIGISVYIFMEDRYRFEGDCMESNQVKSELYNIYSHLLGR